MKKPNSALICMPFRKSFFVIIKFWECKRGEGGYERHFLQNYDGPDWQKIKRVAVKIRLVLSDTRLKTFTKTRKNGAASNLRGENWRGELATSNDRGGNGFVACSREASLAGIYRRSLLNEFRGKKEGFESGKGQDLGLFSFEPVLHYVAVVAKNERVGGRRDGLMKAFVAGLRRLDRSIADRKKRFSRKCLDCPWRYAEGWISGSNGGYKALCSLVDVSYFSFFVEKRVKISLASYVWIFLGVIFRLLGPSACVARALGSMIASFEPGEGRLGVKRLKKLTESSIFSALFGGMRRHVAARAPMASLSLLRGCVRTVWRRLRRVACSEWLDVPLKMSFFSSFFVEKRVKISLASYVCVFLGVIFHLLGPSACVARALGSMIASFESGEGRLGFDMHKLLHGGKWLQYFFFFSTKVFVLFYYHLSNWIIVIVNEVARIIFLYSHDWSKN